MRQLALALSLAVGLVVPATASAVSPTFIGNTDSSAGCSGMPANTLLWQESSSGPSYAVPSQGVITGWGTASASTADYSERLIVVREGASDSLVGASAYENVPAQPVGAVVSIQFSTRIPVQAGDIIGVESPQSDYPCAYFTGDDADSIFSAPDPGSGANLALEPGIDQGEVNVSAGIEPDADGDGFGDLTQDSCPSDPTKQAPCVGDVSISGSASASSVVVGDTVTFIFVVKNDTPQEIRPSITFNQGTGLRASSVTGSAGFCTAGRVPVCRAGKLDAGKTFTATVVARAVAIGKAGYQGVVFSGPADPNPNDNGASLVVDVQPKPFAGVALHGRILHGRAGRSVIFAGFCPAEFFTKCTGTAVLKAATSPRRSGVHQLVLGTAHVAIPGGTTALTEIKLRKVAQRLLAAKGKLKAVLIVKTHGVLTVATVTTRRITLKAPPSRR